MLQSRPYRLIALAAALGLIGSLGMPARAAGDQGTQALVSPDALIGTPVDTAVAAKTTVADAPAVPPVAPDAVAPAAPENFDRPEPVHSGSTASAARAPAANPPAASAAPRIALPPAPVLMSAPATVLPGESAAVAAPAAIAAPVGVAAMATQAPAEPGDLWARIRRGFRMPDLTGPRVERSEKFYASKPDYVGRMTERARRYLFHIVEEVERRGLPTEIALLPFIESAFNPQALSSAKASGMWQFIPDTGKLYGLKQNMFQDERRDVLESTRAALDYLTKLHGMFGDWQLAFAAYNWGEGAVQRAIERNQRTGKPTDYASLKMPEETRNYVPKLQAVKNIIENPEQYNLELPPLDNEEYFTTITKTRDIDVARAAKFAGMSVEEFRALNPSFTKPVIVGAAMPQLVLPKDKADQFVHNLSFASDDTLSSYTAHRMVAGETIEQVAERFGTTAAALRDLNGIPGGARPRAGAAILVPKPAGAVGDIPEDIVENGKLVYEPGRSVKRTTVKVRKGDTMNTVARRNHVTAAQLAQWNGLPTGARLQAGQALAVERVVAARTTTATARKGRPAAIAKKGGAATKIASTAKKAGGKRTIAARSGGKPARTTTALR